MEDHKGHFHFAYKRKAACNSKREQMLIHANDSLNINGDVTM